LGISLLGVVAACGTSLFPRSPETTPPALSGTWIGHSEDGRSIALTFVNDHQFTLTVDQESGGGTYAVDFAVQPPTLDVRIVEGRIPGDAVHAIVELVDANTMRMANNEPGRPTPRSLSHAAVVLKRRSTMP
jgi:hypothetical protein